MMKLMKKMYELQFTIELWFFSQPLLGNFELDNIFDLLPVLSAPKKAALADKLT